MTSSEAAVSRGMLGGGPQIGILGGTFNPPHVGHLVCAQEALAQLGLDRVLLMPAATPPHKQVDPDAGADARAEMCRLAVEGDPGLEVSTLEIERGGPSYTVDTLRAINADAPGDELTFILGADMALTLPQWREPAQVLELARFAVADRAGAARAQVEERLAPLAGADRVVFFDMPRLDVSSSDVRARVAAGEPIRHLVPDAVARYIADHGLYGARAGREVA